MTVVLPAAAPLRSRSEVHSRSLRCLDMGWVQAPFLAKMSCRFSTQKVYHFGPQKMEDFILFSDVILVCRLHTDIQLGLLIFFWRLKMVRFCGQKEKIDNFECRFGSEMSTHFGQKSMLDPSHI